MVPKKAAFLVIWIAFWLSAFAGMVVAKPAVLSFTLVVSVVVIIFIGFILASNLSS